MTFGGEGGWPEVEDLQRRLDVSEDSVHGTEMEVILSAAISQIKDEVGTWHEATDLPTDALAEAALDRAVELASAMPVPRSEQKSKQMLVGQRERFPIA